MAASLTYAGLELDGAREEPLRNVQQFTDVESSDSEASSEGAGDATRGRCQPHACTWASAAGLALLLAAAVTGGFAISGSRSAANGGGSSAGGADAEFGEKVLMAGASSEEPTDRGEALLPRASEASRGAVAGRPQSPPGAGASGVASLTPAEDLHDGNVCEDNEELFAGLCYKKCILLTGGQDAIRTSPWTCCERSPCTTNQRLSVEARVACSGFDIAGDGSCPHRPGACLRDEELLLGVCYKKCSLLTEERFPYRVAPATCCKDSGLDCLDFRKDYTSQKFNVGGGEANPGACLEDEELLLGQCYKKCSLLTNDEYPLRTTAVTCCKAHSKLPHPDGGVWHLGCLDPRNDKTRLAFNTAGDGHHKAVALGKAHYPLKNLTEAGGGVGNVHV